MKIVNYGFDTSNNPIGAFQGIGIQEKPEGAITGEFLGIVTLNNDDYLIGRTTLAFKDDPKYVGKLTARRVTAKKFPDGSGILFIDMEENEQTRAIEEVLEEEKIKEDSLKSLTNNYYDSIIEGEEITATAVKHEVFERIKMIENTKTKSSEEEKEIYY